MKMRRPLVLAGLLLVFACGHSQANSGNSNGVDDAGGVGDSGADACTTIDQNYCGECGECSPQTTTMSCVDGVLVCSCDLSCCGPGCGTPPPSGTFNCNGPTTSLNCIVGSECCFELSGLSNSCAPLSSAQCNACLTKGCYCSGKGTGEQTTVCQADSGVPEADASTDAPSSSEASADGPTPWMPEAGSE